MFSGLRVAPIEKRKHQYCQAVAVCGRGVFRPLRANMRQMRNLYILHILLVAAICPAQTLVDLKTQSKNVDFTHAASTRPIKAGTVLPAACSLGDLYFRTDAAPGANLFACTAANVWTVQSGAVSISELTDLTAVRTTPTVLSIGGSCIPAMPCNVRFGSVTHSITTPATVSVSGGTGLIRVFIASGGALTVGHNVTASCDAGCVAQSGVTDFPADSLPLWSWPVAGGTLDSAGGSDLRAFLSAKKILPGAGLRSMESGGTTTVAVDEAAVSLRVAVPATNADACATGVWAFDSTHYYLCVATNSWMRVGLVTW